MDASWLYMYMPIAGVDIFWPGLVLISFTFSVFVLVEIEKYIIRRLEKK